MSEEVYVDRILEKSVWPCLFGLFLASQNLVKITAACLLNTKQKSSHGTPAPLRWVNASITHFYRKRFHPGQFALIPFHFSSQLCGSGADPGSRGAITQFRFSALQSGADLLTRSGGFHVVTRTSAELVPPEELILLFFFLVVAHKRARSSCGSGELVPCIFYSLAMVNCESSPCSPSRRKKKKECSRVFLHAFFLNSTWTHRLLMHGSVLHRETGDRTNVNKKV